VVALTLLARWLDRVLGATLLGAIDGGFARACILPVELQQLR